MIGDFVYGHQRRGGTRTQPFDEEKKEEKMLTRFFVALQNKIQSEEGQGLVEYALIIVLVSVLLVAGLTALKNQISVAYSAGASAITP
jgi:Flp pilus assembly pilin Flp